MNCNECGLKGRTVVPYFKPASSPLPVLLVGQAPGGTEAITKVPFTGAAGKMQYSLMRMAGLRMDDFPRTNVCSCDPPEDRRPTEHEILCCQARLIDEINSLKPELIVALGDVAITALTGKSGAQRTRGSFLPLLKEYGHQCDVLCCVHPSFVMRQRQWIPIAVKDLQKIPEYFLNKKTKPAQEDESFNFLIDPEYDELLDYLQGGEEVAFDLETTDLNPRTGSILGISFAKDEKSAAAIYLRPRDERWPLVIEWLEDASIEKLTQNGSFDYSFLVSKGIEVKGLNYDTRAAEQMLHSDLPTNLDFLRAQYTSIPPYKPTKKEMARIAAWGKERMLEYACMDAVCTKQVAEAQKRLLTPGQSSLMQTLLMPLIPVLCKMELRGVKLDINSLGAMYSQVAPIIDQYELEFQEKGVNPASPVQLKKLFDLPDTAEETLLYHIQRGRHPDVELMKKLLEYRKYSKMATTYLRGLYERQEHGRIHTHYLIDGTGTGRLSSRDPNLQNQPEEMRVLFIPDDPDFVFIEADYKQLELYVGAVVAEDKDLLNDLREGRDIHNEIARLCFPNADEITKDLRLRAKTVVFGTFYGRSARSIAVAFGVTIAQAEEWQAICITRYPGLGKYKQACERAFRSSGSLTTPWGRTRFFQMITQGYNFPIQSTASDITLSSLILLDKAGVDLRLTVHDSILWQVHKDEVEESLATAKTILMRKIPQLRNEWFPATFKVGPNWLDMEEC